MFWNVAVTPLSHQFRLNTWPEPTMTLLEVLYLYRLNASLERHLWGGGLPPHDGSIAWCADLEFERYSIAMLEGTEMLDMPSSPTREPGCA